MTRLSDAILPAGTAYNNTVTGSIVTDLRYGGMHGYSPDLTEIVNNQQYVRKNLVATLIQAPKAFQYLPDPSYWNATLRSLVELHALSIDGLNGTLEVEYASTPVGGAGQQQEDVTNVTETPPQIVFRWNEKVGLPVYRFLRGWITALLMDPNSKFATLAATGQRPGDLLSDMTSMTVLFYEPDHLHQRVNKAWLVTNMMPRSTGEMTGRRDLTQAGEAMTYDVGFTGIAQFSTGVDLFAQQILDGISLNNANPYLRQAFIDRISADVLATNRSYEQNVESLGAGAVRP